MMDYSQARSYADSLKQFGIVPGLETMTELMRRLGNPQEKCRLIQVAGTNGKGSFLAFLQKILTFAGYRTGRYISPSVFSYREMISIDEKPISRESYACLMSEIKTVCEQMTADGFAHPTVFEAETALAYCYFYVENCDIALIETGMGGDLDATNITTRNLLSCVMSVSLDHTRILGNTLEEIASHKAGIIKKACPVVLYGQSKEVETVIAETAKRMEASLVIADERRRIEEGETFSYTCANGTVYSDLQISLLGDFQKKNAICALEAAELLKASGFSIQEESIRLALASVAWPGRFQQVSRHPLCYMDGAHNPDAARVLAETIKKYFTNRPIVAIIGILADKDYSRILDIMLPLLCEAVTLTPPVDRGLDGAVLAEEIRKRSGIPVTHAETVTEAWKSARIAFARRIAGEAEREPVILAFGSLSWLGEFAACAGDYRRDISYR